MRITPSTLLVVTSTLLVLVACDEEKPATGNTLRVDVQARNRAVGCDQYLAQRSKHEAASLAVDNALFDRAASGRGDPVAEASAAAQKGDFRFVGYSVLVPGIFPAAYGVECRPPLVFTAARRTFRAIYATSDVVVTAAEMEARAHSAGNFSAFGLRYNRALMSHPTFPYHDICREADKPRERPRFGQQPTIGDYGYRNLRTTDDPIDLGEAARRGTLQSVKRLAPKARGDIDAADMFDMTPLAWAIAYCRADRARALLEAGASPAGAKCRDTMTSPVAIAKTMDWRAMTASMERFAGQTAKRLRAEN